MYVYIYIYNILTHAHTEKKRAAVTSLGHWQQRWQVGTPLSLSNKDLSLSYTIIQQTHYEDSLRHPSHRVTV